LEKIAKAAAHRLSSPEVADRFLLQYGFERGYESFRRSLASFLTEHYHNTVSADDLLITAGKPTVSFDLGAESCVHYALQDANDRRLANTQA
jgi:DNA-binding transcriptional MocR family regulator